jgi:hypothetical protein
MITLTSVGPTEVANPDYTPTDPEQPPLITRDYGFGLVAGEVTVNGAPLAISSWSDTTIVATVDTETITTGQLLVKRGDNGSVTPVGITLHVLGAGECVDIQYVSDGSVWPATPIQDAIDTAPDGGLVLVGPGVYRENPIIWRNVRLQGSGQGTFINGNPVPFERVTQWHMKINEVVTNPLDTGMFEAIEAPCIFVHGDDPGWYFRRGHLRRRVCESLRSEQQQNRQQSGLRWGRSHHRRVRQQWAERPRHHPS